MPAAHNAKTVVNYDRLGSGPAALLFNHSGTSNLSWSERFLETLAKSFTVIAPDHRGTGLSSPAKSEFSMADLAADGRAVLDREGIERAIVIGTSMGGAVAQEFALIFPERASSLVLIGTFAGNTQRVPPDPWVIELIERASRIGDKVERWRQMLPTVYSSTFLEQHGDFALELELKGLRYATEETFEWHGLATRKFEAYERLAGLSLRTLVIHGTADPIMPFENGRILARQVPNSKLVALDGVGHLPAVEEPIATAGRIREFARSIEPGSERRL